MDTKILEVRDRMTCIPVIAIRLGSADPQETKLAWRAGYGSTAPTQATYVLLAPLTGGRLQHDPYGYDGVTRTLPVAHRHLVSHWDEVPAGSVVDVRYVLGETDAPADSDV